MEVCNGHSDVVLQFRIIKKNMQIYFDEINETTIHILFGVKYRTFTLLLTYVIVKLCAALFNACQCFVLKKNRVRFANIVRHATVVHAVARKLNDFNFIATACNSRMSHK